MFGSFYDKVVEVLSTMSGTTGTGEQPTTTGENDEPQTPGAAATAASSTTPTSTPTASPQPQPNPRPPPSQAFIPPPVFMEIYDCAKLNNNWNKVSTALAVHPEWLSKIPEGRRWTMLHQIVFSGDVTHLNEVLGLQASNADFRLLCKTLDDKTVREVAAERAHVHPQMLRRIERLVAIDQLLNNAKDRKWDLVKQCITLQPDIVNEKPPYRRYYLAHHLAFVGDLTMFKELSKKCHFKLDLLAENKTISQVAREHNHSDFAEHVDNLMTASTQSSENDNQTNEDDNDQDVDLDSDSPSHGTGEFHFSPGFYEDPGISFIPANIDLNNLFPTSFGGGGGGSSYSTHHQHHSHHSPYNSLHTNHDHFVTHSMYHGHNPMAMMTTIPPVAAAASAEYSSFHGEEDTDHSKQKKSVEAKPIAPQLSAEEQAAYEKTVAENVQKLSQQNLLNSITCCITKAILRDPVVAADGFTYEREAILNWFTHSNRSPMTNQELDSLELKPNHAIKSILQLLQGTDPSSNADSDSHASAK